MTSRKRRRPSNQPPCNQLGSDDGIDPRYYFRSASDDRRGDRKVLQLCAQVARAVRWALGSLLDDERLHDLEVVRVEPAPDARCLRVVLRLRGGSGGDHRVRVACLHGAQPRLRRAVAQAIRRRRVPDLVFEVRPEERSAP